MNFLKKIFSKSSIPNTGAIDSTSFENVSNKIFPYFKQFLAPSVTTDALPNDFTKLDNKKTYDIPQAKIVFLNICEDLNCLYAVDMGNSFDIIQERHLADWNIDQDTLHLKAIENFRSLMVQKMTAKGDTNGIMFIIDGNLEAGLVLIEEIWTQLEEQIGEPIVITVPSRDVIMATGRSNRTMIDTFKANSKEILLNGNHPLSKNMFIRESGQWRLFERILA
mgnify:CR=1 FL=1